MSETPLFRQAVTGDLVSILEIIGQAQEQMRARGSEQWQNGYPAQADIARDMASGEGYVLCLGQQVVSYGAVIFAGEPAYEQIQGAWRSAQAYVVVHRLAVADQMQGRGLAHAFLHQVEQLCKDQRIFSFRVDTSFDNQPMLQLLQSAGFIRCGEVRYASGTRQAFEKLL